MLGVDSRTARATWTVFLILLLVAGTNGYDHLLWIVVFFAAYRLFQDYILMPRLLSAGAALHPLLVIFGVLAGAQLAGIPGAFLSVPVIATLRIVYRQVQKTRKPAMLAPEPWPYSDCIRIPESLAAHAKIRS